MSGVPPPYLAAFAETVTVAVDLAALGQANEGIRGLQDGMRRAVEIWDSDGPDWAGELVARYRDAIRRFEDRYGAGHISN